MLLKEKNIGDVLVGRILLMVKNIKTVRPCEVYELNLTTKEYKVKMHVPMESFLTVDPKHCYICEFVEMVTKDTQE